MFYFSWVFHIARSLLRDFSVKKTSLIRCSHYNLNSHFLDLRVNHCRRMSLYKRSLTEENVTWKITNHVLARSRRPRRKSSFLSFFSSILSRSLFSFRRVSSFNTACHDLENFITFSNKTRVEKARKVARTEIRTSRTVINYRNILIKLYTYSTSAGV